MSRINLRYMPSQPKTNVKTFAALNGGLNTYELDYLLPDNQSAEMENLWWSDGVLECRDGQRAIAALAGTDNIGRACSPEFHGSFFFHINGELYRCDPSDTSPQLEQVGADDILGSSRGTFFRFQDSLMYKNRGHYLRIDYTANTFTVTDMTQNAYTPVILINADPETGSGDLYQPENRLSSKKTVWYNAGTTKTYYAAGDGTRTEFRLPVDGEITAVVSVYVGANLLASSGYALKSETTDTIVLATPPSNGEQVTFVVWTDATRYVLPVKDERTAAQGGGYTHSVSVVGVTVDGVELTEGPDATQYTVVWDGYDDQGQNGTVTIVLGSGVTPSVSPPINNTVRITYSKENEEAYTSLMDCPYAHVFKSASDLCILLGGSTVQPNVFFWNGNSSTGMDPSYFPVSYYNLAGDTDDPVTGFGTQYSTYVLFKERQIGKLEYSVVELDGRDTISFTYTVLNSVIGCDMPWSIQTAENNLVWCNKRNGVHLLQAATPAYENNVVHISRNIDGNEQRPGLKSLLRQADPDQVCSFDDGNRYWLVVNTGATHVAYIWDYEVSGWGKPAWFPQTNIPAVGFFHTSASLYHLSTDGKVIVFERSWRDKMTTAAADPGVAINKVYAFPPQYFGSYDRLKDVMDVVFSIRGDTVSDTKVEYHTDYETREDLTKLRTWGWSFVPRNLTFRNLAPSPFAAPARRKPNCRHVQHFAMRLSNNNIGEDLAILSAQIFYRCVERMK